MKRGAVDYLRSFKLGETRVYDGSFSWRGLASTACYLTNVYGWRFRFETQKDVKLISRVE